MIGEEAVCLVDVAVDHSVAVAIPMVVVMMPLAAEMMLSAVEVAASAGDQETDTVVAAIAVDEAAMVAATGAALVAAEVATVAVIEVAVVATTGAAAITVRGEREDRDLRHKTMASECDDMIMGTFLDLFRHSDGVLLGQTVHCAAGHGRRILVNA